MRCLLASVALTLFSSVASVASGQPVVKKPKEYVGEVIIVGNTITQDHVIRGRLIGIVPGQPLVHSELRTAEQNLARLGFFKVDRAKKIGPTVTVLEANGPFKDILVKVEEIPTRKIAVDVRVNSIGQPVVRLLMEEPNFDSCRWPTSLADIQEDKAFRGAGQRASLELMRINMLSASVEFFAMGLVIPAMARPLFENVK